jgi:aconitase B
VITTNFANHFRNAHERVQEYLASTELSALNAALDELATAERWLGSDQEVVALKAYRRFVGKLIAKHEPRDMRPHVHDRVGWARGRQAARRAL